MENVILPIYSIGPNFFCHLQVRKKPENIWKYKCSHFLFSYSEIWSRAWKYLIKFHLPPPPLSTLTSSFFSPSSLPLLSSSPSLSSLVISVFHQWHPSSLPLSFQLSLSLLIFIGCNIILHRPHLLWVVPSRSQCRTWGCHCLSKSTIVRSFHQSNIFTFLIISINL